MFILSSPPAEFRPTGPHSVVQVLKHIRQEASNDGLPAGIALENRHAQDPGSASYTFFTSAQYRLPTQLILPQAPPHDFAILANLQIRDRSLKDSFYSNEEEKKRGGYLFAVRGLHQSNEGGSGKGDFFPVQLGLRFGQYDPQQKRRLATLTLPLPAPDGKRVYRETVLTKTMYIGGFDNEWHQLGIAVSGNSIHVMLDCQLVASTRIAGNYDWSRPVQMSVEDEFYIAWSGEMSNLSPLIVSVFRTCILPAPVVQLVLK